MRRSENVRNNLCALLGLQLNCNETVILGTLKETVPTLVEVVNPETSSEETIPSPPEIEELEELEKKDQ